MRCRRTFRYGSGDVGLERLQMLTIGEMAVPGVGRTGLSLQKQAGNVLFNLRAIILRKQQDKSRKAALNR